MKASRKYLDHTADVLFQAEAPTLAELFEQCALAVQETQIDPSLVEEKRISTITGEDTDVEKLLFDFLDDLLFEKDAHQLVFHRFEISIKDINGIYKLKCRAYGEQLDNSKHDPKVDVKAITMHLFEVKKIEKGWKAQVLIDI